MSDKPTQDSEGTIRRAFTRQILTESPVAAAETPAPERYRRNIIQTPENEVATAAPKPPFKPRKFL